ncbi:MAG TPA: hypothetical protein VN613_08855 [Gemmatimonadaceae bacterium]|nr:hypothetical protein [Gemmatimonadaceae bacterium]
MTNEPELNSDELEAIARRAAGLPLLTPSRDLWSGIEARIQAPVIALPHTPAAAPGAAPARLPWRRLAVAASLLVAATAGITYTLVARHGAAPLAETNDSATVDARLPAAPAVPVSTVSAEQTFDREIGALHDVIEQRRKDLDPATIAVLEKNLKLIDAAIAESKAALAKDPASAFLMDRLTRAYDTKLQLLSGVAAIPSHG